MRVLRMYNVPLPLRSVWLRGALKASLTPPKGKKKIQEKKLAEKGQEGEKEAQQERGVLSRAGLHKILANSGEKTRPEIRNGCSPSGPKRGLSSAQSQSICVARGARAGWTAMRRQGRPQIECEAGQGRGWMKRASVWHVMRRALAAPPRWTRMGAGEWWWYWVPTGCRTPLALGVHSGHAFRPQQARRGVPSTSMCRQSLERGARRTSTSRCAVSWRRLRISTMGLPEAFNHIPARSWGPSTRESSERRVCSGSSSENQARLRARSRLRPCHHTISAPS